MDLFRNLEVVIMFGFGALCAAAFSAGPIAPAGTAIKSPSGPAPVVVVTGKRPGAGRHAIA